MKRNRQGRSTEATEGRWLTEPLREIFDESAQRRALYLVSLTAAFALSLELAYIIWAGIRLAAPLQFAFGLGFLAFLAVPLVVRLTSSKAAGTLVVLVAMSGLVIVPAYYQGGASAIFTIWFLLVPLMAGFLLGHRFAILLGVLGALVMSALFGLELAGRLPHPTSPVDPLPAWLNLVMVIAFSSTVGAASSKTFLASSRRIREATRAEAAKARALEETIEGIAEVDGRGRFMTVNAAFAAMHGSSAGEMRGSVANDWVGVPDRTELESALASLEKEGKLELSLRGSRQDGSAFFENLVMVWNPEGERGDHYRFVRDVSQQRELSERLSQSVKMEAIGRLAGGIAHDFNNLLMTILGATDQLRGRIGRFSEAEQSRELLGWVETAAQRAALLTRQLLDFSHVQKAELTAIDVQASLGRLVDLLRSTLGTSIEVVSENSVRRLHTRGDVARFESGLMNLAVNARDAMPEGGTLSFRISEERLHAGDPRFVAFELEGESFVRIEVTDTGTGIPPELQEKIFDPFYTTKMLGKGTGLGLSLFYTYTREMGGALEVESELGVGTTVRILLPLSDAPSPSRGAEPPMPTSRRAETILLAEDEGIVAELLQNMLRESGYSVIRCADGAEALARFQSSRSAVDLVLLDYRMPVMDGIEAFEAIHASAPEVPVVMMSGNVSAHEVQVLRGRGLRSVLRKPCSRAEVLRQVREALDRVSVEH